LISIPQIPLSERIRPYSLDSFFGQEKLVGTGKPIRNMIEKDSISSLILWGPPGTGKTTLAKIISEKTSSEFFQLNAVSSGVKEVREVIKIAKENLLYNKRTILFIDEIHRFNKSQQDALLNSVESGELTLIGATTENPSFEVIPALRSRARVYILEELSANDLKSIIRRAVKEDEFLNSLPIKSIDENYLLFASGGDSRILLNILEDTAKFLINEPEINITQAVIENIIQQKNVNYDKNGEEHYNIISAFIKSIRGSDPDAALYWMVRMLEGGEDPLFIARRLVILASEDIGNASPNGLVLAESVFSAVHKIGMPEARIILSQCVTYLASVPKSNSSYLAVKAAENDVRNNPLYNVPLHLRNAPTNLMKSIGYGKEYKYPHDFEENFIQQNYFPSEMKNTQYYYPTENGQEKNLKSRLQNIWKNLKNFGSKKA
jgi:putative ATPase